MNSSAETSQGTLTWVQPSVLHREFELHSGETVLARIRWEDVWGTHVSAESAEGNYLFDHSCLLHPQVSIQDTKTGAEVARNECKWNDTESPFQTGCSLCCFLMFSKKCFLIQAMIPSAKELLEIIV